MADKVLVIQEARLGDLLQSGPLLEKIHGQGGCPTLLLRPGVVEAARSLGMNSGIISWPGFGDPSAALSLSCRIAGSRDFVRKMRSENFSRVIVLNHHGTGIALANMLGVPVSGFDHLFDRESGSPAPLGGWPAYLVASSRGIRALNRIHLSDMWQGFEGPGRIPSRPAGGGGDSLGPVVVVLGGRSPYRRLSPEALHRLLLTLERIDGHPVILSGGPEDGELGEALAGRSGAKVTNTAGRTTVQELVALISQASVVFSPDTATLHLAASLGVPSVGLFFASALPYETGAYREGALSVVTRQDCYPCSGEGASCPSISCRNDPDAETLAHIVAGLRRGEPARSLAARLSESLTACQLLVARETPSGLLQEALTPTLPTKEGILAVLMRRFVVRYLDPTAPLPTFSEEISLSGMNVASDRKGTARFGKGQPGGVDPLWFVRLERGVDLYLGLRERCLQKVERERMVERLASDFPMLWPLLHHLEWVEGGLSAQPGEGDGENLPRLLRAGASLSWEAQSAGRLFGAGVLGEVPEKEDSHVAVR